MNRATTFLACLALAASLFASSPAFAGGGAGEGKTVVARFEDAGQSLEIASDGAGYTPEAELTLVYRDESGNVRTTTVHPESLTPYGAPALDTFLGAIDPDFLSFVRSVVADRLLHLRESPSPLAWTEAAMFFPSTRGKVAAPPAPERGARTGARRTEVEFVLNAVD